MFKNNCYIFWRFCMFRVWYQSQSIWTLRAIGCCFIWASQICVSFGCWDSFTERYHLWEQFIVHIPNLFIFAAQYSQVILWNYVTGKYFVNFLSMCNDWIKLHLNIDIIPLYHRIMFKGKAVKIFHKLLEISLIQQCWIFRVLDIGECCGNRVISQQMYSNFSTTIGKKAIRWFVWFD